MKEIVKLMHHRVRDCLSLLLLAAITIAARAQTATDFSGLWKQDNDRCQPKRSGDVTLRIEHHDPEFTVETSILGNSTNSRHAVQKYTTDGKASVSTGADGDEFHTSVVWKESSLVFSIEEHEDGRILQSKETWSVIEDGATLERIRERPNGEKQTLFFRRLQSGFN
jgi:outer membrane biogenesis lipoprotein LolB